VEVSRERQGTFRPAGTPVLSPQALPGRPFCPAAGKGALSGAGQRVCLIRGSRHTAAVVDWYARQLRFRGDVRGSLSGNLATMGPGVPYGIGAEFGHPETSTS
jgi:hypothetical protein